MKKAIINGGIGSKVICAVTDDVTLEAAPIKGTDNGDGTASLLVTSSMAELPDTASGDLASMSADLGTIQADIALMKADLTTVAASTTCTHDSITLVAANTQYSKAIPANCKKISFRTVRADGKTPGDDLLYALVAGKVDHPTLYEHGLLDGGAVFSESNLLLASSTLYVAGITAGDIVIREMWS